MIRKYGDEPIKAAVIHGGPGAFGSVACLAKELSKSFGVIEPIQSKHSIPDLITELYEQISSVTKEPITLIGHSWGAWLIILFAKEYPALVRRLVLIGSGPFKEEYVSTIMERRLKNLSKEERVLFIKSIEQLNDKTFYDKDTALNNLGKLAEKADNYDTIDIQNDLEDGFESDSEMYSSVWSQAEEMRRNNELLNSLKMVNCPVFVIHGEFDPHPVEGVIEPLLEQGVTYESYILSKCGHSPFKERFAKESFYQILCNVVNQDV